MSQIVTTAPAVWIANAISAVIQPHIILSLTLAVLVGLAVYLYAGPPLWSKMQVFREMNVPYMSPLKARMQFEKSILLGVSCSSDILSARSLFVGLKWLIFALVLRRA